MPNSSWLKKYTTLEHLEKTIRNRELHLGDPSKWSDKNDSECIRLYSNWCGDFKMLATCLTNAPDRFHFWHIFGERERGVCLWFEQDRLCKDIEKDSTLVFRKVKYPPPADLTKTNPCDLPFTKREQYADECEHRVLRKAAIHSGKSNDKFGFSAQSLRRIYLNPWLSLTEYETEKAKVSKLLCQYGLSHVCIKRNRLLEKKAWIKDVSACLNGK